MVFWQWVLFGDLGNSSVLQYIARKYNGPAICHNFEQRTVSQDASFKILSFLNERSKIINVSVAGQI